MGDPEGTMARVRQRLDRQFTLRLTSAQEAHLERLRRRFGAHALGEALRLLIDRDIARERAARRRPGVRSPAAAGAATVAP